eukprot:scaffold113672_cov68-Phaeocystis_antarctica.AAC.5
MLLRRCLNVVASLLMAMTWRPSHRSPLTTQTSSSVATGAVARSAAGMSVSARARARSAAHSRPNLMKERRRK